MIRRLLLLLLCTAGVAAEVRTYDVRLDCQPDGTARATVRLSLSQCTPGRIHIPVGFKGTEGLTVDQAPPGAHLEGGASNGQSLVALYLPEGTKGDIALAFSFNVAKPFQSTEPPPGQKATLPKGTRRLKHTFVNTQEAPIGTYRVEVRFPEAHRAQAVVEALPKLAKGEAGPRALLGRFEGREGILLKVDNLKQGDDTSVIVEFVPSSRSWGWLAAGLVLSALYLVVFRDLVAPKRA